MAQAYTPGLQVKERTQYSTRRLLPLAGVVLKHLGERVQAEDIVARAEQPGDVTPVNVANLLGVPPGDVRKLLLKPEGASVSAGEVLARNNGIFGFFKSECLAPVTGTIESVSQITGMVILRGAPIPVDVKAFAAGRVTEVIPQEGVVVESQATFIQGIFGIGGEAYGPLTVLTCPPLASPLQDRAVNVLHPDLLSETHRGSIVAGSGRIPGETVRRAVELGIRGIIGGGIDDQDLKEILGYDLGVAITGTESIGTTLIITEGFGDIEMSARTYSLLKSREGSFAAITGATQIRAGVMRPEIVIPWIDQTDDQRQASPRIAGGELTVGSPVRIIRDPYFGLLGEVASLPPEPQVLATGSKARVLEVACQDGQRVTVPRANVELIGA